MLSHLFLCRSELSLFETAVISFPSEIMLLLNLAWNDRFVKVSKCNASKIIFNQIIQLFPDRTCRTLTSTCAFRCMILQTCYCRKASFCRMKNGSESVFFRRFCQAVAAALSAINPCVTRDFKIFSKYFSEIS